MDISGISSSLLQQINNGATQTGDAVSISVLRKAMDIQSDQAMALINSARAVAPSASTGPGQRIDTYA